MHSEYALERAWLSMHLYTNGNHVCCFGTKNALINYNNVRGETIRRKVENLNILLC